MGIFWELLQQEELEKQQKQSNSIEERVKVLEDDLLNTKELLRKTLVALEKHIVKDIDGDGKMG
ncbi:MAG: hypothetical protein IPO98_03400 [Saprospiraceae bacterium]|nr:hypothetical protein [Saprospiraceae bacterium]